MLISAKKDGGESYISLLGVLHFDTTQNYM
jgi:hypothetical protein